MDEKLETLAYQLFALYEEAIGNDMHYPSEWPLLHPKQREAWIQVAEFVDAHYRNEKPQPMQESERSPYNGHRYFLNPNKPPDHR